MEEMLKNIYYGNYYPAEKVIPKGKEYKEVSEKLTELSKEFSEVFITNEMKEKFEKYECLIAKLEDLINYEFFKEGYRMGAILSSGALYCDKK